MFPTHLPLLRPDTTTSFYPYPITPRTQVHRTLQQSLRGLSYPISSKPNEGVPHSEGTGSDANRVKECRRSLKRARGRAAAGKRAAGVGLGREAEELSDEEELMLQERDHTNMFGHRFLLPIGRRQTQMEMDNAPSPTPSDADHGRQEDLNLASPQIPHPNPLLGSDDDGGDDARDDTPGGELELDLDDSLEDLDAVSALHSEDEGEEEDGDDEGQTMGVEEEE